MPIKVVLICTPVATCNSRCARRTTYRSSYSEAWNGSTSTRDEWAITLQSIAGFMILLKNANRRRRVGELGNKAEAGRHYRDCSEFLSKAIANKDTDRFG
jgi:hypothetical protein